MEEWKCYGVELKKSDDVSHVSLDEISHSKKTDQNKEAGAQWAYWKKLSMAVNIPFFLTLVIFVPILILKFYTLLTLWCAYVCLILMILYVFD